MTLYELETKENYIGAVQSGCPLFSYPADTEKFMRQPKILVLGNFDGVHIGHRALMREAVRTAEIFPDALPAVWTFESMDSASIKIGKGNTEFISSKSEKLDIFASLGMHAAIFEDFAALRKYSPKRFVEEILIGKYNCTAAICGFNYRFGYLGSGTPEILRNLLEIHGIPMIAVDSVTVCGTPVSSTRIRRAISEGRCAEAKTLLGRYFDVRLEVIHGKQLGRTIGIPTVNQSFMNSQIIPKFGVYAGLCEIGDGRIYRCVTNVGIRPTVSGEDINCESHIIGYDGDLYGKTVTVHFVRYLRGEIRFPSVETLKEAIMHDIEQVKKILN